MQTFGRQSLHQKSLDSGLLSSRVINLILTHHPLGPEAAVNFNAQNGNMLNVLCFDGSAHTVCRPCGYLGGDLAGWLGPQAMLSDVK